MSDSGPILLSGIPVRLYRIAGALGVWRAYEWFMWRVLCQWIRMPRLYDPFHPGAIASAMAGRIAIDPRDHIVVEKREFLAWLSNEFVGTPGFNRDDCFQRLVRAGRLPDHPFIAACLDGIHGIEYAISNDRRRIFVDVIWRRSTWPRMTRGQHMRKFRRLRELRSISQGSLATLRAEVLSREWPELHWSAE